AQVTDGIVTAVRETPQAVNSADMIAIDALDTTYLGRSYAGGNFGAVVDLRPRYITGYAFKMRMTPAERIAIRAAAAVSAEVADFMDLANSA
ncbi:hypothetical protein U2075_14700, partial [Listeria monocytogenes]|uniref:hypothetical protein n=1 Tax=Listeria monocytogenes TaxID=1639 RepID=UPI002FDC2D75